MTEAATNGRPGIFSGGAISLGSCIRGIPVTLHYSYFLLLFIEVFISLRYTKWPLFILLIVVLYGPVLLLTIVVHELGHALTTKRLGGRVDGIVLWPLGGFALCGPTEELSGDLKVALMGPMMHVPMALVWWGIYLGIAAGKNGLWPSWTIYLETVSTAAGFFQTLASEAFYMNLILLGFNLFIPAYPLDGGRIYAASLILYLQLRPQTAAKVTALTAMLISGGMIVYAIVSLVVVSVPGSGLLLGLVGVFIFSNSYDLFKDCKRGDLGNHQIFGRQCYQDRSSAGGGGDQEAQEVPAQSDSAVIT